MLERFVRFGLLVWIGWLVGACSPASVASLLPTAVDPLVTVTTHGGECMDGPCGSTIVIERDGRLHQTAPAIAELGMVPSDVLRALDASVRAADFGLIRSRLFTGECPVAFDGQEIVYEFGAPTGVERVASCETEIDPGQPVFAAVTAALQAVGSVPVP